MKTQTKEHKNKKLESFKKTIAKRTIEEQKLIGEKISKSTKGRIPWNKNLTKDTDIRLKKQGEASSKTLRAKYADPKVKKAWLDKLITPERNLKISLSKTGVKKSLESIEKCRIGSLKTESNKPLFRLSKPELLTTIILEKNNMNYKRQQIINNMFCVDFVINKNIILEINGYWHKDELKDVEKKQKLEKLNYKVIQIFIKTRQDWKDFEDKIKDFCSKYK